MTVTALTEHFEGRRGTAAGIAMRSQNRVFQCLTDDSTQDGIAILLEDPDILGVSFPHPYDALPTNNQILCRSADWEQLKGQLWWKFTFEYSSQPIDYAQFIKELYPSPLDRPARISGRTTRDKTTPRWWFPITGGTVGQDGLITGGTKATQYTAIRNSALSAFDTLPQIDQSRWSHRIVKNYPSDELPDWALWNPDSVNQFAVTLLGQIAAPRTLKLTDPDYSDVKLENGVLYREWGFTLDYFRNGWTLDLLDAGYYDLTAGKKIMNGDGSYPTSPVLLNGSGAALSPQTLAPTTLSGAVYEEQDFEGDLPLDELEGPDELVVGTTFGGQGS